MESVHVGLGLVLWQLRGIRRVVHESFFRGVRIATKEGDARQCAGPEKKANYAQLPPGIKCLDVGPLARLKLIFIATLALDVGPLARLKLILSLVVGHGSA